MRIIEACESEIQTVSISPDGRFVAVSSEDAFGVFQWATGEAVLLSGGESAGVCDQIAFVPACGWVVRCRGDQLVVEQIEPTAKQPPHLQREGFVGGIAVSPDGRSLIASENASAVLNEARLARWSLPNFQPLTGFDYWSSFRRLAFSPNGQFIAGIWPGEPRQRPAPATFELRFAISGGLDYKYQSMSAYEQLARKGFRATGGLFHQVVFDSVGFISFTRDSNLCAFGWENEFHVMDTSTGTSRYVRRVEASFRDAAFTSSGHHFATVESSGQMKLWDPRTWEVTREYDWGCGELTCLAFTADGSAGVCGTTDGKLVQFDVDE